jgi:hypothetical protein
MESFAEGQKAAVLFSTPRIEDGSQKSKLSSKSQKSYNVQRFVKSVACDGI